MYNSNHPARCNEPNETDRECKENNHVLRDDWG